MNLRLAVTLTAGQSYYIVLRHHSTNTGSYTLNTYIPVALTANALYIRNTGSACVVDIDGPGAQEWVHQWSLHSGAQAKWIIQRQSDGFFTIRSEYGAKKYLGISSTSTGTDNIKLYSNTSDNTSWRLFKNAFGELVFEPKTATGKVLFAPGDTNGTKLRLENLGYINDNCRWRASYVQALMNYHVETLTFNIQRKGSTTGNATWLPLIEASVDSWNNSNANTNISLTTSSSPFTCEVASLTETWYGAMTPGERSGNILLSATLQFNANTLPPDDYFRRSTITHEIGHLIGLDDYPPVSTGNESIMSYGRDRYTLYIPQEYDENNVIFTYLE